MKPILSLLIFLPLLSIAQNSNIGAKQDHFIQSITCDTIKGMYKEILFSYDSQKRVTSITERTSMTQDSSKKIINRLITDTSRIQQFEYKDEQKEPLLRRTTTFRYSEKEKNWSWKAYEIQYFIYENGKRVRDSILHKERALSLLDKRHEWDFDTTFRTHITNIKQTDSSIYYFYDKTSYGNPNNLYSTSVVHHQNSINQLSAKYFAAFQIISNSFYKEFDNAINPFNQLNIAAVLANEKLYFAFDPQDELIDIDEIHEYRLRELNWLFLNKHNPVNYYNKGIDLDLKFTDNIKVSYIYNEYKLPIFCSTDIFLLNDEGEIAARKKKNFAFRYVE